jgi:hypothetical protein
MFVRTPVYTLPDQTLVFGLRLPALQPANTDQSVVVDAAAENRLDLVAARHYGRSDAWWALADASGLVDPLAGVPAGTLLRAPAATRLPS